MTQPIYQNYDRVICERVQWKTTCNMHLYYEYHTSFRKENFGGQVLVDGGVKHDDEMSSEERILTGSPPHLPHLQVQVGWGP